MKTNESKVVLQLKNQTTINVILQSIVIAQEGFDANLLMNQEATVFLLEKQHKNINTTINLTTVTPYVVLQFNNERNFTGATFSLNANHSPFTLQSTSEYFLLLPYPLSFDLHEVKSL